MTEEVSISNHQVLGSSSPQANEQPPTPTMETDQPAEEQNGAGSPASNSVTTPHFSSSQQLYCLGIIKALKKKRPEALPFLQPVDLAAYPNYTNVISGKPMDLGTVEQRLQRHEYASVEDFCNDVSMIWRNCYEFNGDDFVYSKYAKALSRVFDVRIKELPELPSTSLSATASFGLNGSEHQVSRPKRKINPPSRDIPSTEPPAKRRKSKLDTTQLNFCKKVLEELYKRKHSSFAHPFYQPVNWKELGLLDYPTKCPKPMDLSLIRKKLGGSEYETAGQFEQDVRLMFRNCYVYNPEGNPYRTMGQQLEKVFNEKWMELPTTTVSPVMTNFNSRVKSTSTYPQAASSKVSAASAAVASGDVVERRVEMIHQTMQQVQQMLQMIQPMANAAAQAGAAGNAAAPPKKKAPPKASNGGAAPGVRKQRPGAAASRKKRVEEEEEVIQLSFDQKRLLSEKIYQLPADRMLEVVGLIQSSMPQVQPTAEDEIELDIETLDPKLVSKLYRMVVMRDAVPAAESQQPRSSPSRKQRPAMTEEEEEARLAFLQKKLNEFENPSTTQEQAHVDVEAHTTSSSSGSDSTSGEEESGTDSDSGSSEDES